MAFSTGLPAPITVGAPAAAFAAICVTIWIVSRKRPGENLGRRGRPPGSTRPRLDRRRPAIDRKALGRRV
ncbi:hypothetical protein ACRAWD_26485 [Caulobacter segnis]